MSAMHLVSVKASVLQTLASSRPRTRLIHGSVPVASSHMPAPSAPVQGGSIIANNFDDPVNR